MNSNLIRHALVLLAIGAGIAGMGMVFSGVMHQNGPEIERGIPLLLLGLWWSGRELGRSIIAARTHRIHQTTQAQRR